MFSVTKSISILGSTGSIGTQALCVVKKLGINVEAVAAYKNIDLLEKQIREFKPKIAAVYDEEKACILRKNIADLNVKVVYGIDGLCEVASVNGADTVLNSVVGMVGLKPTLEAINSGKNIALANKETLVVGGELVMSLAYKKGVKIFPVDSEHSAIFQCLQGCTRKEALNRIILTASGGPFFGKKAKDLKNVTVKQALNHPNWSMGAKITIDSATMMNKGLEVIEASWLFDMPEDKIDIVIHRESIVHSMIEYKDNSVIAQLGIPDMKIPIQYSLTYPERVSSDVEKLDLTKIKNLTFYEPDYDTFLCLKACREALKRGGLSPAVVNGANEEAVKLFLENKISFLDIGNIVYKALKNQKDKRLFSIDDILEADKNARDFVHMIINSRRV